MQFREKTYLSFTFFSCPAKMGEMNGLERMDRNMEKKTKNAAAAICLFLLSAAFTAAVVLFDVAPAGPSGVPVGFSRLNEAVFEAIGEHRVWYDITECLGFCAIAVMAAFALAGLLQWIGRKSLKKIDRPILLLGGLYAAVIALYVIFEIFVINERPVIMPGESEAEASFPSSHTMLILTVFGSAPPALAELFPKRKWLSALRAAAILLMAVAAVGRLFSGVHWCTDILAGTLYAFTLLSLYVAFLKKSTC